MIVKSAKRISGEVTFKGDKSVSHRLVLLSLLNKGTIELYNISNCNDVKSTIKAVQKLGVEARFDKNTLKLKNDGSFPVTENPIEVDCGNSGTTARLLTGILATRPGKYIIIGDKSLSERPMKRVIEPLSKMGAKIKSNNGKLPIEIKGTKNLKAISFYNSVLSAQVKSAILFAALAAEGTTTVTEATRTRDHTERLLSHLLKKKVEKDYSPHSNTKLSITVLQKSNHEESEYCVVVKNTMPHKSRAKSLPFSGNYRFDIPGDASSAAFFAVAAIITPHSDTTLRNVLLNTDRIAFLKVLKQMGAQIEIVRYKSSIALYPINCEKKEETTAFNYELRGDIKIRGSRLRAINIVKAMIPALIDELPILAIAMVFSKGISTVSGASELRVKESDRIGNMISQLKKIGISCKETEDGYQIEGYDERSSSSKKYIFGIEPHNEQSIKTIELDSFGDHRLAMAFCILALATPNGFYIRNTKCISISFPEFFPLLRTLTIKAE